MTTTVLEQAVDRRQRAAELYRAGVPLREITQQLGVAERSVYRYLRTADRLPRRRRHLSVVPPSPRRRSAARIVPQGAGIAFTADRGWHLVEVPPSWLLDVLAEID